MKYFPTIHSFHQLCYIHYLRKKKVINVVFLPMTISMWKYQNLYELLKKDNRFNVYVFLSPFANYDNNQRIKDLESMRSYFKKRKVKYIDFELEKGQPIVDINSVVNPDIMFYTQPYETVVEEKHRYIHFIDKFLCYTPYSFIPRNTASTFNSTFENLAWKLFYQTELNKKMAQTVCKNKGKNVVVTGYLSSDEFLSPMNKDVWKDKGKKRIIWAPHFTITDNIGFYKASYFLEMAELMKNIAIEYADKISIAFKPHPRLFSELCHHSKWGKDKALKYYEFWKNNRNTQLETGDFIDLFKGSDAMIHDSGSFVVDYLYFNKPVLYDNPNINGVKTTADEIGIKAYDCHYKVNTLSDIKRFIDDVVLNGNDNMEVTRKDFYNRYLKQIDGKTVSQAIYENIVNSIWGDNSNNKIRL